MRQQYREPLNHAGAPDVERWTGEGGGSDNSSSSDIRRSDDRIRLAIAARFGGQTGLNASRVSVHVLNGEVTLTGIVSDAAEQRRAEDLARSISGVVNVTNNIEFKRAPQGSAPRPPSAAS